MRRASSPPSPWRITLFLSVIGALNYADRAAFASVMAPIQAELKLSDAALGFVSSLFLWSYAVGSPLAGILADRFSRTLLVVISLAAWSLSMGATGFAGSFVFLCLCRIGVGLGEAPYHPAAYALVADHQPARLKGRGMSALSIGMRSGVALGGTVAGFVAERFGWRSSFWVLGALGLLLAAATPAFVADAPRPKPLEGSLSSVHRALSYLATDFSFLMIVLKQILAEASTWVFISWLPLYLYQRFHLSLGLAGFVASTALAASFVAGSALGGWLSDALAKGGGEHRLLAYGAPYLCAAPILLLFLLHPGLALAIAAATGCFLVRGIGDASERPATSEVVPRPYLATAYGILNCTATLSGASGVLLAGVLKKGWGLEAIFASSSAFYLVIAAALLFAWRRSAPADIRSARKIEARA